MKLSVSTEKSDDKSTFYVLARLEAAGAETAERNPVNLALVIDRSSSMRGPRIAQALLATREVVASLGERDRLTIITFDGGATTLFGPAPVDAAAKKAIEADLDTLRTGVGTNLGIAIKKGAAAIRSGFVRGAVSRLILLTDGQPSVGVKDGDRLCEMVEREQGRGVQLTTMGIGESFGDDLLAEMARRGRGGFHYLADAADIASAFGRELDGVFTIAATDTELKFVPHNDVISVDVLHRLPSLPDVDGLRIEVGELAANAPRAVLFKLTRNPLSESNNLGTLMVKFKKPDGSAGDSHIVGVEVPQGRGDDAIAVADERLRLLVASAVDTAWARRASGDRQQALDGLAVVRDRVKAAKKDGITSADLADALVADMVAAAEAVASSSAERERLRRGMREQSQITMLGQSQIRRLPNRGDDD